MSLNSPPFPASSDAASAVRHTSSVKEGGFMHSRHRRWRSAVREGHSIRLRRAGEAAVMPLVKPLAESLEGRLLLSAVVRAAAGPTAAAITPFRDAFRVDL